LGWRNQEKRTQTFWFGKNHSFWPKPLLKLLKKFGTSGFWVGEAEELKAPEDLKAALHRRVLDETLFDRSRILFIYI